MNTSPPDPRLLADLRRSLDLVTEQVDGMRSRLGELERQLGVAPSPQPERADRVSAPGPAPAMAPRPAPRAGSMPGPSAVPQHAAGPTWQPHPGRHADRPVAAAPRGPQPHGPRPVGPQPGGQAPWSPPPQPARAPRRPVTASTVLAAIGGAITLLGVGFLLVLAAQAGFFGPVARVVTAAVLAVALVAGGIAIARRSRAAATGPTDDADPRAGHDSAPPTINAGALALVGTGFATAVLDVVAATSLYHWLPVALGYVLTGALAVGGMVLARQWRSPLLATLFSLGVMLLAPLIARGVELPCFLVVVSLATALLCHELGGLLRILRTLVPALAITGYLGMVSTGPTGDQWVLFTAAILFAVSIAVVEVGEWAALGVRSASVPPAMAIGALPLLALPVLDVPGPGVPVVGVLGTAYLAGAVALSRLDAGPGYVPAHAPGDQGAPAGTAAQGHAAPGLGRELLGSGPLAAVTGLVGSTLVVVELLGVDSPHARAFALVLLALAYVVTARVFPRPWTALVAGVDSAIAVLSACAVVLPWTALSQMSATRHLDFADAGLAAAVAVLAAALTWWSVSGLRGPAQRTMTIAGVVVTAVSASVAVVALGVTIGDAGGFVGAHLVVTVLWIALAGWLVLTRTARIPESRTLGFVLVACALVKLFLLDLATLPGLLRVVAFLVVGGVLLAVATRYRGDLDLRPRGGRGGEGPDPQGPPPAMPGPGMERFPGSADPRLPWRQPAGRRPAGPTGPRWQPGGEGGNSGPHAEGAGRDRPGAHGAPAYGPGAHGPGANRTTAYGPDAYGPGADRTGPEGSGGQGAHPGGPGY